MTQDLGYPRPLLQRAFWISLDGEWDFRLDPEAEYTSPAQVHWNRRIRVPFSPETPASGIGETGFYRACWYRRQFEKPEAGAGGAAAAAFRRGGLPGHGVGEWPAGGRARGRLHAVFQRHHRLSARRRAADHGRARRGRPGRPLQAARQAGLAARSALHLVPAHHGHLANASGWSECPPPASEYVRWTPNRGALGDRLRGVARRRAPRRPAAERQALRRR